MAKTIQEINEKIKKGKAVVYTAEEIIDVVNKKGAKKRRPAGGMQSLANLAQAELAEYAHRDGDPFLAEWVETVLEDTLRRMETDCRRA